MEVQCLVVDEEPKILQQLGSLIRENPGWKLAGEYQEAAGALAHLRTRKVDLIFWDLNLPDSYTRQLSALNSSTGIHIVFTTTTSHNRSLDPQHGVDVLHKPISRNSFLLTKDHIQQELIKGRKKEHILAGKNDFFYVKTGNSIRKLFLEEVLLIEGQKEYVRIIAATDEILVYKRLKEIEKQFPLPFIRIHNSYIINCRMLEKIHEGEVYIGTRRVPISEKYKEFFWDFILQYTL